MTASPRAILWVERLVWILGYGGLFAIVLGIATIPGSAAGGWALVAVGAVAAIAGAVLVWVRSILDAPQ